VRRYPWLLVAVLASGIAACGPSEEQREAARVLAAVDALRQAEHRVRAAKITALERLAPHTPRAAAVRSACLDAYRALDRAEALTDAVEAEVKAHTAAGIPPPDELLTRLGRAQTKLDAAEATMPACSAAIKALRGTIAH